MKISSILPILAVAANKRHKKKAVGTEVDDEDRFSVSKVTEECKYKLRRTGGSFDTVNTGFSGQINLDNYSDSIRCKHVVQASSSCEAIKVSYNSVAVESA